MSYSINRSSFSLLLSFRSVPLSLSFGSCFSLSPFYPDLKSIESTYVSLFLCVRHFRRPPRQPSKTMEYFLNPFSRQWTVSRRHILPGGHPHRGGEVPPSGCHRVPGVGRACAASAASAASAARRRLIIRGRPRCQRCCADGTRLYIIAADGRPMGGPGRPWAALGGLMAAAGSPPAAVSTPLLWRRLSPCLLVSPSTEVMPPR